MAETKLFFLPGGRSGQRLIIDLGSAEFKEEPELNKTDEQRERELQAQRERELQEQRERELQAQREREQEIQDERERELQRREQELEQRERAQRERELQAERERLEKEQREREIQAQRDREKEIQAQREREKELEERERELEKREKKERERLEKEQREREVKEQRERDRERLEKEKREKKERERLEKEQREREKKERKERERLEKEQREREKREGKDKDKPKEQDNEVNQPVTELDEDLQSLMTLKGKIIVIDPGHGGNDAGAIGPTGVMEKNVTLKVSLELRKLLEAEGAQVIMTRYDDSTVSAKGAKASDIEELGARCDVANRAGADIFISIHADSFTRPEARGTTGYYYSKSTTGRGQKLADCIRRNLVEQLGTPSRGTQPCNFYVVKNTDMPATLIELGFISNKEEEKLLDSADGVKRAAQGIFDGIEDYFG
ncbi:MAG: N-acetylmuramoyl-L-alanine amidase [Selenomonadaceae bacterium]|nr:N-acetylmuramoyl-L-alanine amidase [Selenomonadaceae bacterium]